MKYKDPDTPVCVIENGTMENQRIITGNLKDISKKNIKPPALVVIGDVVNIFKEIKKNID